MPKNIIVCTDGTWDSASSDTNVVKLSRMLISSSQQVVSYDDGVGVDGTPLEKLTGGAFGDGILQKVKNGYAQVAQVYDAGDNIFLFGFSRGAYTARSIAGMIATCGLPTGGFDDGFLATVFNAYRTPSRREALLAGLGAYNLYDAKLRMVGVWDTVGALGIPALFGGVEVSCQFLDTQLHPDVVNAYQAIAIDERRAEFPPTLWQAPNPPNPGQTLVQAYFAGVHCDVGGGYPETDLSDITLGWMLANAKALGALFDDSALSQYVSLPAENALGLKHESWNILWTFPRTRTIDPDSTLGNSVGIRYGADSSYRPSNLNGSGATLASSYGSVRVVDDPPPGPAPAASP
jgi:uncharacterized protein (DUF2235 family)